MKTILSKNFLPKNPKKHLERNSKKKRKLLFTVCFNLSLINFAILYEVIHRENEWKEARNLYLKLLFYQFNIFVNFTFIFESITVTITITGIVFDWVHYIVPLNIKKYQKFL